VSAAELVTAIDVVLGKAAPDACLGLATGGSSATVVDLSRAVDNALGGCNP